MPRGQLDGRARYVVEVDAARNQVVVGTEDLLGVRVLTGDHARWCGPAPAGPVRVGAQVRAHGPAANATATTDGEQVRVELDAPVRGVATGQSVVLYDGTRVVGSARILETTR
jgi:tRNA-specific 2-thiouridylase